MESLFKRLLIFSMLILGLTGCGEDEEGSELPPGNERAIKQPNPDERYNRVGGIIFNKDSVVRAAILQYNFLSIADIATEHLEKIIKSNRTLLYTDDLGSCYGYLMNSSIWDSLKYFGYQQSDVSNSNKEKDIYLSGRNQYKDKGQFEDVVISNEGLQEKHPKLYEWAVAEFYKRESPTISDLTIPDQSGVAVEYIAKVKLTSGTEQYISFVVTLEKQQIVVKLNKSINQ